MKRVFAISILMLATASAGFSQTWEKINTGFNYILMGIEFPESQEQIGFSAGESSTYMGDGIVIKTSDGGTTWTQLWTGVDQGIEGISFPDLNTGYVAGWSEYFAKTTDGGLTWTTQTPGTDIYFYTDVAFKDANHGVVTAQTNTGAGVYVTSNGGTTWTNASGVSAIPYGLCHAAGDTYFLANNNGDIQKSTDNGLTWTTVYSGGGMMLGVDFYNALIGIGLSEDGRIVKTYDGGTTWQTQITAFGQPLWRSAGWDTQNDVYTVGTPEYIFKSTDGGATWTDDYPASTYNPALYDIHFGHGIGYICGSQGWFYRKTPLLTAAFTSGPTTICNGSTVQFTDQSVGDPTSWNWTFEGGTPSTSTQQNPVVTYSTPGVYDVTLVVTKLTTNSTLVHEDMITVEAPISAAPVQAAGATEVCGFSINPYTTSAVAGATGYSWTALPSSAGSFSGNGISANLSVSNLWSGAFTVQVAASNSCGAGPYSPGLGVVSSFQPLIYNLFSGGGYCSTQAGFEIKLSDSDAGILYQLFKDGVASGAPVTGTGSLLSFGLQPAGDYTVTSLSAPCNANMAGVATNFLINLPETASMPSGPATACAGSQTSYNTSLPANGFSLLWNLNPAEAGTITQPNLTSAVVSWNPEFSGAATLSVQGLNECGAGPASAELLVTVNPLPTPAVSGTSTVCKNQEVTYLTAAVSGNLYTWSVTGGSITTGQGTNEIKVLWLTEGTGIITVEQTSADNCTAVSQQFAVAVEACTDLTNTNTAEFAIFPNPVKDILTLSLSGSSSAEWSYAIYNQSGQEVLKSDKNSINPNDGRISIVTSGLPSGVYSIVLQSGFSTLRSTFIKN